MDTTRLIEKLNNHGFTAATVGGYVRDQAMGIEPHDIDLATNASPEEVVALFPGQAKVVSATFSSVVMVKTDDCPEGVEVATFRAEGEYSNGRRPDWVETLTRDKYPDGMDALVKDLERRDFTINAMAIIPGDGTIVDPFSGRADVESMTLRSIPTRSPHDVLVQHPARILRAMRFGPGMGFSLAPSLADAIANNIHLVATIPGELVYKELMKGLASRHPDLYIRAMLDFGILEIVLPEVTAMVGVQQNIHHGGKDVFEHSVDAMMHTPNNPLLRLAVLLHDAGKVYTQSEFVVPGYGYQFIGHEKEFWVANVVARRLKMTNHERRLLRVVISQHMSRIHGKPSARRFLSRLSGFGVSSPEDINFVLAAMEADRHGRRETPRRYIEDVLASRDAFTAKDLAINGHDIMETFGLPPSPAVGEKIRVALNAVMDGVVQNEKGALLEFLKGDVNEN